MTHSLRLALLCMSGPDGRIRDRVTLDQALDPENCCRSAVPPQSGLADTPAPALQSDAALLAPAAAVFSALRLPHAKPAVAAG